jgi:hypothetical protein
VDRDDKKWNSTTAKKGSDKHSSVGTECGAGMGSGEFASALANYKAATLVVAPLM